MTLGLGRASLVRIPVNERFEMLAGGAGRRSIAADREAGLPPDRDRGDDRDDLVDLGRSGRRDRRRRRARGPVAPRRCRVCRAGGDAPGTTRAVRRLGARRLDRRQPAQVAVHAARRVAPADAPDGRSCAPPSASCPEYLRTLDRDGAGPRLQRVHAAARASVPGAQAVDPAALVRARGPASPDRAPPRRWPSAFARWVDADPDWERLAPVPFSTVCFRWRPAGRDLDGRRLSTSANAAIMDAVNRTGEVFLSHTRLAGRFTIRVSIGNLRTEPRHVERAWALLREAAARMVSMDAARRPLLRDARGAARLVRRQPCDRRRAVARATTRRRAGVRASTGRRSSTRRCASAGSTASARASTTRSASSASRRAARAATGAPSTSPRSAKLTEEGRMRPAGRGGVRGADRREDRDLLATNGQRAIFEPTRRARFRADEAAWADWQRRPPSYRRTATHWVTSAKQAATRERRLATLIEDSRAGRPLKQLTWERKTE